MVDPRRVNAPSRSDGDAVPSAARVIADAALVQRARASFDGAACSYVCAPDGRLVDSEATILVEGDPDAAVPPTVPLSIVRQIADVPYEIQDRRVIGGRLVRGLHRPIFGDDGDLLGIAGRYVAEAGPSQDGGAGSPDGATDDARIAALESALEDTEARLLQAEAQLARALEDGDRRNIFLASMAHELRTPLNAVIGFSEAALSEIVGPLPTAYRGYLENILRAGRHLGALAESVLETARLDRGECECQIVSLDLADLVMEARAIVGVRAERSGIDLSRVTIDPGRLVMADELRTRQILINLLSNAINFTAPGGSVGVDWVETAGDAVALTVWDSGIGIDPVERDRIFEAYYQIPTSRRADRGGAGLGLAIARKFARAMGGDIVLDSEPGKGSRFTVLFRRAEEGTDRLSA